jgi:hypothetical protein
VQQLIEVQRDSSLMTMHPDHLMSTAPDEGPQVCEEPTRVIVYQGRHHVIPESEWPAFVSNLMRIGRSELAAHQRATIRHTRGSSFL